MKENYPINVIQGLVVVPRLLASGNQFMREGRLIDAMQAYGEFLLMTPQLSKIVAPNIARTRQLYRANRAKSVALRVGVCGWELAHNAAGRAHTLALLYEQFASVEIIGCLDAKIGREIWLPLRNSKIPTHTIVIDEWRDFFNQAVRLVIANPYDVIHLSKPRAPNIIFGILYKIFWGAKILVDVDDEELAFVNEIAPLSIAEHLEMSDYLPILDDLAGKTWTRLSVGMAKDFDGVTISNDALKTRYGGLIIHHARNENLYRPSEQLRRNSRKRFGISQAKKVIIFFGTPRPHKGLLETARAISYLQRDDILFAIFGEFPDPSFKDRLNAVLGVNYLFFGDQPFEDVPEIVAMADVCVLLQQDDSNAARFQTPAKLGDALGMRVPVIATDTIALADVFAAQAIMATTANQLHIALSRVLDDDIVAQNLANAGRCYFDQKISFSHNVSELSQLINETKSRSLGYSLRTVAGGLSEKLLAELIENSG